MNLRVRILSASNCLELIKEERACELSKLWERNT